MRHALVTSGTKGLGVQVTKALLKKGYTVTVSYRTEDEAMKQLETTWGHLKDRIQLVQVDVTKKEDIYRLVDGAYDRFGRIDVVVNNAGPYIFERKKLFDYEEHEWQTMVNGNLSAAFYMFKKVLPIMRNQQFGRIILYGFQGANTAPAWLYRSAYAAAKVGLVSLMKTVAVEEAEYGITVNMVCPGNIVGEMKEATIEESRKQKDPDTPIGRSGTGEDIARTVAFLCEDDSDMVTGSVIEVTGAVDVLHRYR
ncbi:SDR family oxidoreductase [Halalkalibacterium halodurans]|jgi:3-oxoacyl-[acyl-carrier protein] reductase|uniref:3-oxoacyl-[acyl-carrier protein] reductase n=2 Tax=Halalkalibacterium halodurans TaxID=86665 RepID=Q9K825_HALH5|nr:SDR family oxidoreductase [Halalkalibacterium halodurans]MDY7223715.1 SDR family oxidoreductase [Halalkalibacterium halodurans]MDY7242936.1 SDR family oxidoreductase [Halalkalibacterium halodurans]MED3648028.1 SDR family oxidoreductase [Halalkalibacterium halodurans]MED4082164.1 SDR family oxidoreductase [Halalkalibacterium halodurans]MED4084258.1 SDR family oxidoreductase [Halalkalibacterium halodurans]